MVKATALLIAFVFCVGAASAVPGETSNTLTHTIDIAARGKPFNPGVRGVALSDGNIQWDDYRVAIPTSLAVSHGSSLRGVAGGLYADLYDWRTRVSTHMGPDNTQHRPPTLEYLRWARDTKTNLFITANARGLVQNDPTTAGKMRYYTTDTVVLARLAGDWVRYTNRIAREYRQGDRVRDARDRRILDELIWSSGVPGDSFDRLLKRGEAPVASVKYWEIGNEPTVRVTGGIGVTNGIILEPDEYHRRYKAIAAAMKAEDPSIKVGPCIVNASSNGKHIARLLADRRVPVDFIAYHPYQKLGVAPSVAAEENYLAGVYDDQRMRCQALRDIIGASGRDPRTVEMVASEVNVSDWRANETRQEGEMSHALGSVETIFSFARLGLTAAHYWIWTAHQGDGTSYPVSLAFERLRDCMGDRLLDVYAIGDDARIYTTRDSRTGTVALWALSFRNAEWTTVSLSLRGLGGERHVTRAILKGTSGPTTLRSANLSASQEDGPRHEVEWVESSLICAEGEPLLLTLEPATISVLTLPAQDRPGGDAGYGHSAP